MDKIIPTANELLYFTKLINEMCGVDLSEKKNILEAKFDHFLKGLGFNKFKDFLSRLSRDSELKQKTLDFITVNETYFYRELAQLKQVVFYLKSLERPVSVLSAPCSSGEEVYSFAILLALNSVPDVHITGIDINQKAIEKAKIGKYQGRSLDKISTSEKGHFFSCENGTYTVNKQKLCRCRFELCNVFDDKFLRLGKFDVIFSRNMMIYFDYESRLKLLENFYKISNPDCRLYVGNSDLVPSENLYFTKVFAPNHASFYLRNEMCIL